MKTYDVTVTETLQMTVPIEAESLAEAGCTAEKIHLFTLTVHFELLSLDK